MEALAQPKRFVLKDGQGEALRSDEPTKTEALRPGRSKGSASVLKPAKGERFPSSRPEKRKRFAPINPFGAKRFGLSCCFSVLDERSALV